jgi:hypothetical protein
MRPGVRVRVAVVVVAWAALLAACSAEPEPSATAGGGTAAVDLRPAEPPSCAPDEATAYEAGPADDAFAVVTLGSGERGVVLSPQSDASLCQWVDQMERLAAEGYHVASYDWPLDAAAGIPAAVAALQEGGVEDVALVGASKGGAYSAALADELDPAPVAVVALGPPAEFGVDARSEASTYAGPLLVIASTDDASVDVEESREVARADDPDTFVELPGSAHGVALFDGEHRAEVEGLVDDVLAAAFG